jgi:predicted alpha/beta-fold hydrolase
MLTKRGGHVEYLVGKEEKWWAYEMALKFFEAKIEEKNLK